jgi:hypothetical protein
MTSWLDWDISDNDGTNPLGQPADFEFRIEYDYDPGDPGYMYDSNGDGYPASNPAITLTSATCATVCVENEQKRVPTQDEARAIADWFWTELDRRPEIRDQIRTFGFEQMELEPDWDDLDD